MIVCLSLSIHLSIYLGVRILDLHYHLQKVLESMKGEGVVDIELKITPILPLQQEFREFQPILAAHYLQPRAQLST